MKPLYPFIQSVIDIILDGPSKPKPIKEEPFQRLVQVKDLPDFMQGHDRLKGVYVGGCIANPNGKWDKKTSAHAHTHGPDRGYICCPNEEKFKSKLLLKHELAHILSRDTHNKGHGREWAAVYVALKAPTNEWLTIDWLKQKYKWKKIKKKDRKDAPSAEANKSGSRYPTDDQGSTEGCRSD